MTCEKLTFEEWLSLSEDEQDCLQRKWNPYKEGYWHGLRAQAEAKFRKAFEDTSHVVEVHGGLYHGGTLIIGVTLDLPSGTLPKGIPSRYAGFHVQHFWTSGGE